MVELSKEQEEILYFLTKEFLTIKQIAQRRQTHIQAVYKTVRKLKAKGVLKRGYKIGGIKWGGYSKPITENRPHLLRLHNIQENLKIIESSEKYHKLYNDNNKQEIDGFTLLLYEDNIQIYTTSELSFFGLSTDECYLLAINAFDLLYNKIEEKFNIIINKEGKLNHNWVRQHIAETNNEIARESNENKEHIRIKAREDHKTWLVTDNSFKLDELEFTHPKTAKRDTERVIRVLNDIREHETPTISEIMRALEVMTLNLGDLTKVVMWLKEKVL